MEVAAALVVALAGMCALVADVFDLTPADRAGLFAGSATNTPSLQAASEAVTTGDPVVAYSLAYPAACPGWADHTYGVFLPKHRRGNPGGYTE